MGIENSVRLIGNLGDDPRVKYTQGGMAITEISLATTSRRKDKDGNAVEETQWHRVKFFGKLAEIAAEYLKKGTQVFIEGSLRTRKWQDKEGQDRYTTEIVANEMQMLSGRDRGGAGTDDYPAESRTSEPAGRTRNAPANDLNEDVPF